jgi:hypothetical protein
MFQTLRNAVAALAVLAPGLMAQSAPVKVTHILGWEGLASNVSGNLSVQSKVIKFEGGQGVSAQINTSAIRNVTIGESDKQVGGVPLALGRAATPYGGGRVIALFSHKKFDTLTVEYTDTNGAFHGAIFQLPKGQAEGLKTQLVAQGARAEAKPENK